MGMDTVDIGSDMAQRASTVQQVGQRQQLGQAPGQWLVDGGFRAHQQLDAVAGKTEINAPVAGLRAKKAEPANSPARD